MSEVVFSDIINCSKSESLVKLNHDSRYVTVYIYNYFMLIGPGSGYSNFKCLIYRASAIFPGQKTLSIYPPCLFYPNDFLVKPLFLWSVLREPLNALSHLGYTWWPGKCQSVAYQRCNLVIPVEQNELLRFGNYMCLPCFLLQMSKPYINVHINICIYKNIWILLHVFSLGPRVCLSTNIKHQTHYWLVGDPPGLWF